MSLKKHLLSFFAFLLIMSFIIISNAQNVAASSSEPVSKKFYEDGKTVKSETYILYKNKVKVESKVYEYNLKGKTTSYVKTKYSGKKIKATSKYTYKYYSNGKKKQVNYLSKNNGKKTKFTKTYYKSNGKKSIKYVTNYSKGKKANFTKTYFKSNGKESIKYVTKYSKGKKRIVTKYKFKSNKAKKVKRTYYYNTHTKSKKTMSKAYAKYNYKNKKFTYFTKKGKRNAIVVNAKKYVGKPYRSGGSTPKGFDCSGYTSYVYKKTLNKKIGRTTHAQNKKGKYVKLSKLKPGDIVFWGSKSSPYHVGIYVSNGKYIHASTPATGVKKDTFKKYKPNYAKRMVY